MGLRSDFTRNRTFSFGEKIAFAKRLVYEDAAYCFDYGFDEFAKYLATEVPRLEDKLEGPKKCSIRGFNGFFARCGYDQVGG